MSADRGAPRLVVYGVGQFGQLMVRLAAEKGWPVVAAFNRAGPKVGQDVGLLAGLDRATGVVVQDSDTADYSGLDADLAIVSTSSDRLELNLPACERLLGAGLNVLCHAVEAYHPRAAAPDAAATIDALAKRNNVTFTGGGIWDMSRIWSGLLATGPCTEIESLLHTSTADVSVTNVRSLEVMGVGLSREAFHEQHLTAAGQVGGHYLSVLTHVLSALGYEVVDATERREPVLFDEPIRCEPLARELGPGTAVGMRILAEARTREGVDAVMRHEGRLFRPGETEFMAWEVTGRPTIRMRIEREDKVHFGSSSLFNRVRDVIAASPGIRLVSELGPMRHTALEGRAS